MPFQTARQMLDLMRTGQASALELTDDAIAAIEAGDGAINAVVVRDFERAREAARAADAARAAGEDRPLLGVPMTVKECYDLAGLPSTWGLPGPAQPAAEDAVAVQRLKAAGAIVLGKTNTPVMLADWQSFNPVYGLTRNPWNLERSPGGSSGGSAAALAAGFVPLEFGTDLSGSLRAPAAFCGVLAHKPTWGLVPNRGCAPPGVPRLPIASQVDLAVAGPLARTAADLALAFEVTAGPDAPMRTAWRLELPPQRHERLADFRVLVVDEHPLVRTASEVRAAVQDRARALEAAGCTVLRCSEHLPDLAKAGETFATLLFALMQADTEMGAPISHGEWVRADRVRLSMAARWRALFGTVDVVLTPAMPTTAFPHDQRPMGERALVVDGEAGPYETQSLWCALAGLTGQPATAVPLDLSAEGLPIGGQIVGPLYEDRTTLAFAAAMEQAFGGLTYPGA